MVRIAIQLLIGYRDELWPLHPCMFDAPIDVAVILAIVRLY